MNYDAILFDMDGVLLRGYHTDPSVYREATETTLADFGVETDDVPSALVSHETVPAIREACEDMGVPADPVWAYRERTANEIENDQLVAGERRPFPDVDVLSTLADSYRLGVVSNNRHGTVRFAATQFGWPVEVVRGRLPILEEFGRLKPDPMLLRRAFDTVSVSPADTLYIGDRVTDVEAAHTVGADAALLSRDEDSPKGATPELHLESLDGLPDVLSG